MKTNEIIRDICINKTFLDEESINKIIEVSKSAQILADFNECDIFIDVLSRDKNSALVVFHGKPTSSESIYRDNVVGAEAFRKNEPGVLKTLQTGVPCKDIKAITQENKIVKQKISPVKNHLNEVIGVLISERDISEKLSSDFKIESTNNELVKLVGINDINNIITNNLDDGVLIFDNNGKLLIANSNAKDIYTKLGYFQEIIGMSYNNLSLDKMKFSDIIRNVEKSRKNIKEIPFGDFYFKVTRIYIENNCKYKLISVIKDITDSRKKEKEMELKEVEVKEAHHRIKNNLQATAALLRRQSRLCINETSRDLLDGCVSRILTIASTHDLLSKSNGDKISAKAAISAILTNIETLEDKKITHKIIGDDFYIHGAKATALLIVINEIAINSYKHGFKDIDYGNILVEISKSDEDITLTINDNGKGFDVESCEKSGLGISIIESYVTEVLNGKIITESNENGTYTTIKFKNN